MIRIRAVDVILRVFDPLAGTKLSMCTALSLGRQIPRKGSRRSLNGLANIVDNAFDQHWIVALRHHSDEGFGARLADHQATPALKLRFGGRDPLPDAVSFQRLAGALEAHVL